MGKGQELWRRAKSIIPGGNMLLSKRSEMFLPEKWPSYYSKAKGCKVWDLDGKQYTDMSIMGIGTNILGYGDPEVDEAVCKTVRLGNMSTLNCPEEVELAERLLDLHPWSDMARFARTGGEATSIAVRIARSASGKDKIAVCGYHGWHDWYLSANLGHKDQLDGHLLSGLQPNGVPKSLAQTVLTFNYNKIEELEKIITKHEIGTIIMEVSRNLEPQHNFLKWVRALASKHGIVLIFDECTSGFRQSLGGLHKFYDVEPDMAIFGKALGNGGRYDHVGEAFGRARPATGFAFDLKSLMIQGQSEASSGYGIFAPFTADTKIHDQVSILRSQGNRVVQGFEGQKVDFQEMKCDRQIIKVDGKYIVQSLS